MKRRKQNKMNIRYRRRWGIRRHGKIYVSDEKRKLKEKIKMQRTLEAAEKASRHAMAYRVRCLAKKQHTK
jgi:hypothetical protein